MTLAHLIVKNGCRNKRRSVLTILGLTFSFLLLIFMITIWRTFYVDEWSMISASHIVCRNRASLAVPLPSYYRDKIRGVEGVVAVIPLNRFEGDYKDPIANDFEQIGTDPVEYLEAYPEYQIPPDQVTAWQKDAAGAIAGAELAARHGWKPGDKLIIVGDKFPLTLELTLRGIFRSPYPINAIYFNWKYVQEALRYGKDQLYLIQANAPQNVGRISNDVDEMFRNSPERTRTEAEKAFDIGLISMFGNVKAFILSVCAAVLFASLLVSANTTAMSIHERTREVAVMRSLGFEPRHVLGLFTAEAVTLSLAGCLAATLTAYGMVYAVAHSQSAGPFAVLLKLRPATIGLSFLASVLAGLLSALLPSYRASRTNIVHGLRHIG